MQRFGLVLSGLLCGGVLLTAACSGGAAASGSAAGADAGTPASAPTDGAQQVTLNVDNGMSFDPTTITVRAGQPVELTLRSTGQMPHDFTLTEGVASPVKITATGGQAASGTFTLDTPGTYTFVCSMPLHAAAGMRGTIEAT
jgi:plastocyanin